MLRLLALVELLAVVAVSSGADNFGREDFPPEFLFGASTSAYQVEGAANEDGRTPSIFDTFSLSVGADGSMASDQYHKYKEDVQLMVDMGIDAYRFSISWTRLIPNGTGQVNPKGLQYYNNLINELISHGIQPHVTLHHHDLPQALEDDYGGWVSRKILKDFTAYADVCFKEFGDRVQYWTTLNEANVFVMGGYDLGVLPPQRCSAPFGLVNCSKGNSITEPYRAAHNIILAHALAARLYRRKYQGKQKGFIGFNIFSYNFLPLTNKSEDISATQRIKHFYVGWFLDPFILGDYPELIRKSAGSKLPSFTKAESKLVKGSIDFFGVNYYETYYVKNNPSSLPREYRDLMGDIAVEMIGIRNGTTTIDFANTPWGLQQLLEFFKQAYGSVPVYIHENGQVTPRNSSLDDYTRVEYLKGHIGATLGALRNGSNLRGYFVWSFLDVLELFGGYETSFGLHYIDLDDPDLRRQPKLSAKCGNADFKKDDKFSKEEEVRKKEARGSEPKTKAKPQEESSKRSEEERR
ncbi:hypothetical protein L6164_026381 [Bauhinia variegata]|uniref:Uncharacterized protein n=1 Tax=Bauhinia variegata TaxID=167791 RepID=A0ACB9LPZ6_BAUVA|nr:hypothetical protein L6164_026381 [Bauhinia variegata]